MGPTAKAACWSTSDLSTAAYAKFRGLQLLGVRRQERSSDFTFEFADPDGRGRTLQIEYSNSEFLGFDDAIRCLKKLCYDGQPRRRPAGVSEGG